MHVVIVGFDRGTNAPALYEYDDINGEPVEARPAHINGYLLDASDVFVEARRQKTGPLGLCRPGWKKFWRNKESLPNLERLSL